MLTPLTNHARFGVAALALLAPLQLLAVVRADEDRAQPTPVAAAVEQRAAPEPPAPLVPPVAPAGMAAAAAPPAPSGPAQLVTEQDATRTAPAPPPPASFADRFPFQAAAAQDPADPATTRWALLIGINEHRGIADNIGSRQDAEDLRTQLLARGWRDDHILLLTDRQATRDGIIEGLVWLADKTDEDSVAVFHYSGHSKTWSGQDLDGDGEVTDEGLWPSDNRFIVDSELVRLLDPVRARATWVSFATCNAAGFADPGLARPGRILTFSSSEARKSYEHPAWGNSVWGSLVIDQAFGAGLGDLDGDGRVTVEEAFAWARPRAVETTNQQRYGAQDPVMIDLLDGDFDLRIPGAPPAPRQPAPDHDPAPPGADPAPPPREPQPEPSEPTEENHGNRICLLCGR